MICSAKIPVAITCGYSDYHERNRRIRDGEPSPKRRWMVVKTVWPTEGPATEDVRLASFRQDTDKNTFTLLTLPG